VKQIGIIFLIIIKKIIKRDYFLIQIIRSNFVIVAIVKPREKIYPPEREHIHDKESSTKQKLREGKAVAKQKSIHGRILAQKRNLERKDKQERITSRKRSL